MPRLLTALALLATPLPALAEDFTADIWADNWFEMRVDGAQVAEDSVPITTERSFNAESVTFAAQRPFVLAIVAKDFKQDDTGLEYIGTRRQQMGDGGLIAQIRDAAGALTTVTGPDWRCITIHTAPLDKSCENASDPQSGEGACTFTSLPEPEGWDSPDFDAGDWPPASIYTAAQVDPKDGYDRIDWAPEAEFIWGADLETSNTVLCRTMVE